MEMMEVMAARPVPQRSQEGDVKIRFLLTACVPSFSWGGAASRCSYPGPHWLPARVRSLRQIERIKVEFRNCTVYW